MRIALFQDFIMSREKINFLRASACSGLWDEMGQNAQGLHGRSKGLGRPSPLTIRVVGWTQLNKAIMVWQHVIFLGGVRENTLASQL